MNTTAPGWYPDPNAGGVMRYWDGTTWLDVAAPVAPVAPVIPPLPESASASAPLMPAIPVPPIDVTPQTPLPQAPASAPAPVQFTSTPQAPTPGAGYGMHTPSPTPQYSTAPPVAAPMKTSGLAIASLICSTAGTLFAGLGFIAGIITGHLALIEIRKSNGTLGGRGLALAGIIIGYTGIAMIVAVVIALASTMSGNGVQDPSFNS